jgi:MoaA/NifB/PqqE/SkfB family radical SAM enzyme
MIVKHNTSIYFYLTIKKLFLNRFPVNVVQLQKAFHVLRIVLRGEKKRLQNQEEHHVPVPYACILSVTWRCNLKCIGCYAKHYPATHQLKLREIQNLLEQAESLGIYIFVIVGGEPLLLPGIVETLSQSKKILFFFFTNGTLIDHGKLMLIKRAKNIVPIISVEGSDFSTELRRGPGMGEMIGRTLSLFKKHKMVFGFSTMITHKNIREVLSVPWLHSLWAYGARFGFIIDYIPFPRTLDESLVLTSEDSQYKREMIRALNVSSRVTLFNFPEDEYRQAGCKSAGNGFIHVNANGYVEPCPFSHYAADNIRDKTLLEILNSDFFGRLRNAFQDRENTQKTCMLFYNENLVREIADGTQAFSTEKN